MGIARIKKNDTVIVTHGNDAGRTGTVKSVNPKKGTAIVEGLNKHKKAMRRTQQSAGGVRPWLGDTVGVFKVVPGQVGTP